MPYVTVPMEAKIMVMTLVKFLLLLTTCEANAGNIAPLNGNAYLLCKMTMKQIRNTGKMMRKSCQPKNNVEDAKIDPINDGVFIDEKEVKCYMACIMKMANTLKNGKLNFDAAIKQADLLLPDEIKEPAKSAITACKNSADPYKDICDASFYIMKCIYEQNPSIFFFP